MFCSIAGCDLPRKERSDQPGKFYAFCREHFNESRRTERVRENARRSYRANKTERIKRVTERVQRDPAAVAAYHGAWYIANRDAVKATVRLYQRTAAGKATARRSEHQRRAAGGHYTAAQLQARIDFYGGRCYLCGCDWFALPSVERTIDHVIPLARGGTNWPSNLRPACRSCNCRKHTTNPLN